MDNGLAYIKDPDNFTIVSRASWHQRVGDRHLANWTARIVVSLGILAPSVGNGQSGSGARTSRSSNYPLTERRTAEVINRRRKRPRNDESWSRIVCPCGVRGLSDQPHPGPLA